MPTPAQGSAVSFAGSNIGQILAFTSGSPTAVTTETTGGDATIIGSQSDARVVRSFDCTAVDPGSVSVRLLGMPPYAPEDIGSKGTLSFSTASGAETFDAILQSYEVEASVGDLLRGSASFLITIQ